MSNFTPDKWDFRLIDLAKGRADGADLEEQARAVWVERCGGFKSADEVPLIYIVDRLVTIVEGLSLATLRRLLDRANPHRNEPLFTGETDFVKQWFHALMVTLMLALVDDLPGYREWLTEKEETIQ